MDASENPCSGLRGRVTRCRGCKMSMLNKLVVSICIVKRDGRNVFRMADFHRHTTLFNVYGQTQPTHTRYGVIKSPHPARYYPASVYTLGTASYSSLWLLLRLRWWHKINAASETVAVPAMFVANKILIIFDVVKYSDCNNYLQCMIACCSSST